MTERIVAERSLSPPRGSRPDRNLSPPPSSSARGVGGLHPSEPPSTPRSKRAARASASSQADDDGDTSGFAGWAAIRTAVKIASPNSPPGSRVNARVTRLSSEPDSYAPTSGDGAWSDDEEDEDEPIGRRRWNVQVKPWQRDVLKCSISYLLASLFTFIPTLSDWLAAPFDSEGQPLGNAQCVRDAISCAKFAASSRPPPATFTPRALSAD